MSSSQATTPTHIFSMSPHPRASSSAPSDIVPPPQSETEASYEISPKEIKEREIIDNQMRFILKQSAAFASMLSNTMEKSRQPTTKNTTPNNKGKKRAHADDNDEPCRVKTGFMQPKLVTGVKLKDYQLEGVQWMVSLDQNGMSGILADEMGLGKTLQTIAFCAYLREHDNKRPFLIVCPLSVLHNWKEEFTKFAPSIPVCVYHGTPGERAEMRATTMRKPREEDEKFEDRPSVAKKVRKTMNGKGRGRKSLPATTSRTTQTVHTFPVIITTYEMIIRDRTHLAQYDWGYVVVDEGHRLKNIDCKLMQEIKKYPSAGRMILSGTPLQNNLPELWALLNFILPDIFTELDKFQAWFNAGTIQDHMSPDRSAEVVSTLHAILKPFLLRRLKADVTDLPPKKEYVLYAPLTKGQKEIYEQIVSGGIREYLVRGANKSKAKLEIDMHAPRKTRGDGAATAYDPDEDDDEYFERLERGDDGARIDPVKRKAAGDVHNIGLEYQHKATLKQVNNMKLQNKIMQLRKICSHPFLFDWPLDPKTLQPVLNEKVVDTSGKMMVLDRLLTALFAKKHKVLIFSQFTTMLDILQDWAVEYKGYNICRIDGSTNALERREEMYKFQNGGDARDAPKLFLLSTRAGGLGVNLTAADTVIFYDQDWNPQMDIQAQDRAHRIGQTKPVLIFRLVSAHTIETKIMQKATEKRKLEALVIAKGKFKMPAMAATKTKSSMAEMAASLLTLEGEKIEVVPNTAMGKASVLSDEDLESLLDRRPDVFTNRGLGWVKEGGDKREDGTRKAAFAVYEAPADEGNDALGMTLGEEIEI